MMQNMLLAAHSLGLGSCWAGAFDEDAVKKLLRLPPAHRPVALLALGNAAGVVPNPAETVAQLVERMVLALAHHLAGQGTHGCPSR